MFATVSTDIPSYDAIHGHMPLHYCSSLIGDTVRTRDFMNYIFWHVMTCSLRARYHSDLRALIASVKCLDMSIKLRLKVRETIMCGFQRPIGQRRVATSTNEKSYGPEIYKLEIQKRYEFSIQLRLTVVQPIWVDIRGEPARRYVSNQVGQSPLQEMYYTRMQKLEIAVMPLVFQVHFWNHIGSLDISNMDTLSDVMNHHSDVLIGSTFQICSPMGNISITLSFYQ